MAETIRQHRDNLGDLAPLAADLLRDLAAHAERGRLTPGDIEDVAMYLEESVQADAYIEDQWDLRSCQ